MSERFTVYRCPEHGLTETPAWAHTCPHCILDLGDPFEVIRAPEPGENYNGAVRANHGRTSRDAALDVRPRSGTQRARVLALIEDSGANGLTRDQLAHWLRMSPNTVRPRVKELLDGGHICVAPGITRKSATGRAAEVLIATCHRTLVESPLFN